ncbi:MAG: FAD-binding oxidoreductase, partial [Acidimicrobiia bacterium]|nr:FAD-binding oxidoreductase [Acidimicrobiia bacterium]
MNEFLERKVHLTWGEQKPTYDVVVIGGGGHGLSTAYHLATRHGITNVAVLERKYIGGGNSGRNTTVIRSNYGVPESIRFYQRSVELYQQLEEETDRWIMHKQKGILWTVHTEAG